MAKNILIAFSNNLERKQTPTSQSLPVALRRFFFKKSALIITANFRLSYLRIIITTTCWLTLPNRPPPLPTEKHQFHRLRIHGLWFKWKKKVDGEWLLFPTPAGAYFMAINCARVGQQQRQWVENERRMKWRRRAWWDLEPGTSGEIRKEARIKP